MFCPYYNIYKVKAEQAQKKEREAKERKKDQDKPQGIGVKTDSISSKGKTKQAHVKLTVSKQLKTWIQRRGEEMKTEHLRRNIYVSNNMLKEFSHCHCLSLLLVRK